VTNSPAPRRSGSAVLWALGLGGIAVGALAWWWSTGVDSLVDRTLPLWVVVGLLLVAEATRVDVVIGRHNRSLTATEVAVAFALLLGDADQYLVGVAVTALVLYGVYYRLRPLKFTFNVGLAVTQAAVSLVVFELVQDGSPDSWRANVAVLLACMVGAALSDVAVTMAIRISGEPVRLGDLGGVVLIGALVALVPATVGIQIVALGRRSPVWLAVAALPLALGYVSYRAFVHQRRENRRNEFLYRASLALHGSDNLEQSVNDLLEQVRSGLRAESVRLVLWQEGLTLAATAHVDDDGRQTLAPAERSTSGETGELMLAHPSDGESGARLVQRSLAGGITIVASVQGTDVTGLLVVGERLANRDHYGEDDLELVSLVASQLAVALENENVSKTLRRLQELEARLVYQANHDTLTGLASRRLFNETLADRDVPGSNAAVVLIDLDDFKRLNDTIGHVQADEVLVMMAERLQQVVRRNDLVARIGGDEFAIVLDEVATDAELLVACERIRAAFGPTFDVPGFSLYVHCTIGATRLNEQYPDYTALHRADVALYQAKAAGKNQVAIYEPWMSTAGELRSALVREADAAFDTGQFGLLYQPVYDLDTRELVGAEALVRWLHPTRGLLTPGDFLEIIEEAGFADRLGTWVLNEAIAEVARMNDATGDESFVMHVNLSARQLRNPRLAKLIESLLRANGVRAEQLVIELTEGSMIENLDSASGVFTELYELGARIALDDFGTGYSSLTYLHMFPISIVKIDRGFVSSIARSNRDRLLVGAIVSLAHSLGLEVVAEGIETDDQRATLQRLGCGRGQGYLFSRPVQVAELLRECTTRPVRPLPAQPIR
jgi:diguanylate cyclase (GGDEF)-like protein